MYKVAIQRQLELVSTIQPTKQELKCYIGLFVAAGYAIEKYCFVIMAMREYRDQKPLF